MNSHNTAFLTPSPGCHLRNENELLATESAALLHWRDAHNDDFIRLFGTGDPAELSRRAAQNKSRSCVYSVRARAVGRIGFADTSLIFFKFRSMLCLFLLDNRTSDNRPGGTMKSRGSMGRVTRKGRGSLATGINDTSWNPAVLSTEQKINVISVHATSVAKRFAADVSENRAKCHVLRSEIDEIREEIATLSDRTDSANLTFSEARQQRLNGVSVPTAEIFRRWLSDYLKSVDNELNSICISADSAAKRLRATRSRTKRIDAQGGDSELSSLDYAKLQILNEQLTRRLDVCNDEVVRNKSAAHSVIKVYANTVEALRLAEAQSARLQSELSSRALMTERLAHERQKLVATIDTEKDIQNRAQRKLRKFSTPRPIDYIREKDELQKDNAQRQALQRRVSIEVAKLQKIRHVWSALTDVKNT